MSVTEQLFEYDVIERFTITYIDMEDLKPINQKNLTVDHFLTTIIMDPSLLLKFNTEYVTVDMIVLSLYMLDLKIEKLKSMGYTVFSSRNGTIKSNIISLADEIGIFEKAERKIKKLKLLGVWAKYDVSSTELDHI